MLNLKSKISSGDIAHSVAIKSVDGYEEPDKEKYDETLISKATKKKIENSRIDQDAYIAMLEYAKYLPHGKRQMTLDYPALREMLVSNELDNAPMTKTSGLNKGGMIAESEPPKLELLSHREHIFSILNKYKNPDNPNPTAFKNNFSV